MIYIIEVLLVKSQKVLFILKGIYSFIFAILLLYLIESKKKVYFKYVKFLNDFAKLKFSKVIAAQKNELLGLELTLSNDAERELVQLKKQHVRFFV